MTAGVLVSDGSLRSARLVAALRQHSATILTGLCACIVVILAIGPCPVGVFQDDGLYVVLAKSIATGEGYRFLNIPGAPNATHYPPGYPLLLAALWKLYPVFPQNITLFKFVNALLLGVAAILACGFARSRLALGPRTTVVTVLLFTICVPTVLLSVMVLSEPLFLVVLFVALGLAERLVEKPTLRRAIAAGLVIALLAQVRTLGALALPAVGLVLLWRLQWRWAGVVVVTGGLAMLPWQLWVGAHAHEIPTVFSGKYGSYGGWLADAVRSDGPSFLAATAMHNLRALAAYGWEMTATAGLHVAVRYLASIASGVLLIGGVARLAHRAPVTAWFIVAYLGVVLLWPFDPVRFLWGIWPLLGMSFALAVEWLVADRPLAGRWIGALYLARAVPVALLVGYLVYNVSGFQGRVIDQTQQSVANRAQPLAEWVAGNTQSNAVLVTDDDALLYLYTGRRGVPNGRFTPQEYLVPQTPAFAVHALREILRTYRADYVLASSEYGVYAVRGLVNATPPELRIVTVLRSGAVFAPVKNAAP